MSNPDESNLPWWKKHLSTLLITTGFLPLIFWHIGGLLEKPHYQFLFLMPVTLWILVSSIEARKSDSLPRQLESCVALLFLILSLGGLTFAALVWSPWIAAVCFQLGWGSALVLEAGWRRARHWFPIWAFCWIIVPLPFGMDEDLIIRLRGFTTRISSSVLDQIGLLHNSYANVIELPGKRLFIADACSGIHSLYVLMGAALFLCCWCKRGLTHSVCLLVSTFALVLIENVARIVFVALAWNRGLDCSTGFSHEMLGIALFCISLLLIVTTDQLLLFFLPPNAPSLSQRIQIWKSSKGDSSYYADEDKKRPQFAAAASPILMRVGRILSFGFPTVLVLQLVNMPAAIPNVMAAIEDDFELPEIGEDALPDELNGFVKSSHNKIERVPGDPFGQASQQWLYRRGDLECLISIDYPYTNPHDLTVCYTNIGWQSNHKEIVQPEDVTGHLEVDGPFGLAVLERALSGNAMLIFNHTDMDGETSAILKDEVRGTAEERSSRRWVSFFEKAEVAVQAKQAKRKTYLQFQLFARSPSEFSPEEKDDLKSIFFAAKRLLTSNLTTTLQNTAN